MCFSAEASFTAAAVLTVTGIMTIKTLKKKSLFMLALFPFFFALQQFSEGIIWITNNYGLDDKSLILFSKGVYLGFAFIFWPIWLPLSVLVAETIRWRKVCIGLLCLAGVSFALYHAIQSVGNELTLIIVKRSIQYSMLKPIPVNHWVLVGIYSCATIIPSLLSSLKGMWGFGILSCVSWIITEFFYHDTFTSVWCFFSALLSVYIYYVVKINSKSTDLVEGKFS